MRILVKFPSRGRPQRFLNTLKGYVRMCKNPSNIIYCFSFDTDDEKMNNGNIIAQIKTICKDSFVFIYYDNSNSKIHAVNRDIEKLQEKWDICIVASDDMVCNKFGWDDYIVKSMQHFYPDTDGCLWFNDGFTGRKLNTMCMLGKKYYDRFGYIYHPDYTSLWSDNEYTEVAQSLNKIHYSDEVIFKHVHWSNGYANLLDEEYRKGERFYNLDKIVYEQRKLSNFA